MVGFELDGCLSSSVEDLVVKSSDLFWSFLKRNCSSSDEVGSRESGIGRGKEIGSFDDVEWCEWMSACNCEIG